MRPERLWIPAAAVAPPVLLGLLVVAAAAGGVWSGDEVPDSGLVESAAVRLGQFDVVVRDADGSFVTGLSARDFTVVEAGATLEIVAVDEFGARGARPLPSMAADDPVDRPTGDDASEVAGTVAPGVTGAEPASEPTRRSFVILFDNANTTSALKLAQAKRAASEFVASNMTPDDLAAVYQLDMALRPLTGFTSDTAELSRAIERIAWMPNDSFADRIAENVLAYRSRAGIDVMEPRLERGSLLNSQILEWRREHFYKTAAVVGEAFTGLPGRRVMVLVSAGFPMTAPGDFERQSGGFTLGFRDLLKSLGRAGITVYSIDVGDDLSLGDAERTIDWRVAAGKIGIDEATLTTLGLDAAMSTGSATSRRQVLGVLANETGGRLLTHNDPRRAFQVVQEETTHFYRISCVVLPSEKGQRYRRIDVRVPGREGLDIQSRRGRYEDVVPNARSRPRDAEEPQRAADLASFRSVPLRGATLTLPVGRAVDDAAATRSVVVVVEALGPIDLPTTSDGAALDVDFFLVARQGDRIVDRFSRSATLRVRTAGVDEVRKGFRLEGRLDLPPGSYEVQANVRLNDPPQFGTWSASVYVGGTPADELGFGGVLLSAPSASSPLLLTAGAEVGDPLRLRDDLRVLPATTVDFPRAEPLTAVFWLGGVPLDDGGRPRFDLAVRVLDSAGAVSDLPARLVLFEPDAAGGHHGVVQVDLASLGVGSYTLEIVASSDSGSTSERATFQVTTPIS